MSIIDKGNEREWLYGNGYKRRIVYPFDNITTTPRTLRFASSAPYKLFDRQIKAMAGHFTYEVIVGATVNSVIGVPPELINQPLNYKVTRSNKFTVEEVTITGGEVVDIDEFRAIDRVNESNPLPEMDLQGRDFTKDQVFYLRISRVGGTDACRGYIKYLLSETP